MLYFCFRNEVLLFIIWCFSFFFFFFQVFKARRLSLLNSTIVDGELFCVQCGNKLGEIFDRVNREKIAHLINVRLIRYMRSGRGLPGLHLFPEEVSPHLPNSQNITVTIAPPIAGNIPFNDVSESQCEREVENKINEIMDSFIEHEETETNLFTKEENAMESVNVEQNNVAFFPAIEMDSASFCQLPTENRQEITEQPIMVNLDEPVIPFIAPNVQVVHPIVREPEPESNDIDWNLINELLSFNASPGSEQQQSAQGPDDSDQLQSVQGPDFNQEEFNMILQSLREPIVDAEFDEFNAYLNL